MQIQGTGRIHGPQPTNAPHQNQPPKPAAPPPSAGSQEIDQLDISPKADMVSRIRDLPDIRHDLVARIRGEIEAGTYETDEKLEVALGRMLDEFGE